MSTSIDTTAFDRATDPLLQILHREQVVQIADFHADDQLQERIEQLTQKANEGELSEAELAEYHGYAQANRFIAVLKAKAKRVTRQWSTNTITSAQSAAIPHRSSM